MRPTIDAGSHTRRVPNILNFKLSCYYQLAGYIGKASRKCKLSCKPSVIEMIHKNEASRPKRSPGPLGRFLEESYMQKRLTPDQRQQLVNQETERLILANNAFVFRKIQGPKITSVAEWPILQKVKRIFEAFCPRKETPRFVLNGMVN